MEEAEYEKRRAKRSRKRRKILCLLLILSLLIIAIVLILYFVVVPLLSEEEPLHFRLPSDLVPEYYVLHIHPRLTDDNFTFVGNVTINVVCASSTTRVILHAKDLDISDTKITESDSRVSIKNTKFDVDNEFFIINTKQQLKKDHRYQIEMVFSGHLRNDSKGFYWKNYTSDGESKLLAATNFEPTYARRAFPCFDEPALKASFDVTVLRPKRYNSLSNMRKKRTETRDDRVEADVYHSTVKISTYLVAFFVGEFSGTAVEKTDVSIWAKSKSTASKIKDGLEEAIKLYDDILKRLQFPRPENKIDILAIPNDDDDDDEPDREDERKKATVGWGLITADEDALILDKDDSLDRKQMAVSRITRALAHQLFGNVVTPKWWNDAWLSESLATYLETYEIDESYDDWNWMDKSTMRLNEYVEEDCSKVEHVVSDNVTKPWKISQQLDSFAVSLKGWRILRMLNYIMGDKHFWDGLSNFLKDKAFKSVDQDEFWDYMTKAQSKHYAFDLKTLLKNWMINPGHPLITVSRQDSSTTFRLTQVSCRNDSSTLWKIPITYIDQKKRSHKEKIDTWLLSSNGTVNTSADKHNWLLLNPEQTAFYHVNYDKENWDLLASQLVDDFEEIPAVNRYQLLFDSLYFARKNLSSYENFLNIMTYLEQEEDDNVVEFLALSNLSEIAKMVRRRAGDDWKEFIGKITKKLYERKFKREKSGEKMESETKLTLKKEILSGICSVNESSCVNLAIEKYEEWIKRGKDIHRNDRPLVKLFLCTAIRNESFRWEEVENYFKSLRGKFPSDDVIYALGCVNNQYNLHRVLNAALFKKPKYLPFVIDSILDQSKWEVVFDVITTERSRMLENSDRFKASMEILTQKISNSDELAKMNQVYETFKKQDMPKDERIFLERLIKKTEKRISSEDLQLDEIVRWLRNKNWKRV
ncbi:aminopeptidase N-like [Centruroides sculpturatus]|uniref:aminopeptidase N-like n=1 Tax=Centruroides sculpturatus TaxID=218467 RepID=UPI000C6CC87F|nr:aminopeptidase N-like [Centruroides sculpturatus]